MQGRINEEFLACVSDERQYLPTFVSDIFLGDINVASRRSYVLLVICEMVNLGSKAKRLHSVQGRNKWPSVSQRSMIRRLPPRLTDEFRWIKSR